jgi:hypothetical protein
MTCTSVGKLPFWVRMTDRVALIAKQWLTALNWLTVVESQTTTLPGSAPIIGAMASPSLDGISSQSRLLQPRRRRLTQSSSRPSAEARTVLGIGPIELASMKMTPGFVSNRAAMPANGSAASRAWASLAVSGLASM